MTEMFTRPMGTAVFLNAGDPPFEVLDDVADVLDDRGVDVLELGVPFPDSISDGPVIRRSADRALAAGTDLEQALAFVAGAHDRHRHLKIVLLADWAHTVRPRSLTSVIGAVAESGAAGFLLHGAPPRVRPEFYDHAHAAGLPIVTTCYAGSPPAVVAEAADHASAYVYLVAHYGRSGSGPSPDPEAIRPQLVSLRAHTEAPIAVGFGIRTGADVANMAAVGADAAVIGSAMVGRAEAAHLAGRDVATEIGAFVDELDIGHASLRAGPADTIACTTTTPTPDPVNHATATIEGDQK